MTSRRLLPAFVAFAVGLSLAAQQSAPPKLTPLTIDGYNQLLAAHRGRVLLVSFWATYCIPCRAEIPELVKLATQLRARGLDFVFVSADDPEQEAQARKFIAGKAPGTLYIKSTKDDDKYAAAIHQHWEGELPANFIYDRMGRKVGAFIGEVPTKNIETLIEKYL